LRELIVVNWYWSLFNLLPVLPLDGGRVAYAILSRLFGRPGFLVSQILALGVSLLIVLWTLARGRQDPFLLIMFVLFGLRAFSGIRAYLSGEVPEAKKDAAEIPLANAESLYQQGHLAEAKQLAEGVLESPAAGLKLRSRAHHLLGWIAIKEGQGRAALDHFSQVQGERVSPQGLAAGFSLIGDEARALPLWELAYRETNDRTVLHEWAGALIRAGRLEEATKLAGVELPLAYDCAERVLFIRGEFADAARIGLASLEQFPRSETAYDVACSLARAGDLEGALRLLNRASELGFRDASLAAADPDLAALRNDSRFADWLSRIAKSGSR
jgi:Zn-dependent protease